MHTVPRDLLSGVNSVNYDDVPKLCKKYRKQVLKVTQNRVAIETGYSPETVSAFECGRVNNAKLLYWYISHGLQLEVKEHAQKTY